MRQLVGVDIFSGGVRAVSVTSWLGRPLRRFEIKWDIHHPAAGVALLEKTFGRVAGIGISLGLEFLHIKHIPLPPVGSDERRRIVLLEPDRFFPTTEPLVVSVSGENDLVFAAESMLLERIISAFEAWAPVESIEASPITLARALGRSGRVSGSFALPAADGERGIVKIDSNTVSSARRAFDDRHADATSRTPVVAGLPPEYLPAFGAALGAGGRAKDFLATEALSRRVAARSRRRLSVWAAAAVIAVALALFSYDRARERYLEKLETRLAQLAPDIRSAQRARGSVVIRRSAGQLVDQIRSARADPLDVMSILGRALPHDAVVTGLRFSGDEWEVDGTAAHASAIIPALDAEKKLENVRFRSATSRFRDAGRIRESFAIGFRAR